MTESSVSRRDTLRNVAALGVAGAAVAMGASALGTTTAEAAQPLMHRALSDLGAARAALERALADKAGHRVKAISLVDQAIAEVKAGIAAGGI
jgi:hypothetical protein